MPAGVASGDIAQNNLLEPLSQVAATQLYRKGTSFVVDLTSQFERRMEALFCYESQYGEKEEGSELFPSKREIRERLEAVARFYGHLIGARYGEPFVVKETLRVEDIVTLGPRSF